MSNWGGNRVNQIWARASNVNDWWAGERIKSTLNCVQIIHQWCGNYLVSRSLLNFFFLWYFVLIHIMVFFGVFVPCSCFAAHGHTFCTWLWFNWTCIILDSHCLLHLILYLTYMFDFDGLVWYFDLARGVCSCDQMMVTLLQLSMVVHNFNLALLMDSWWCWCCYMMAIKFITLPCFLLFE